MKELKGMDGMDGWMDGRMDGQATTGEGSVCRGVLHKHEKGYSDIHSNIGKPAQANAEAAGSHSQEAPGVRAMEEEGQWVPGASSC